jgi:hypothetical protein
MGFADAGGERRGRQLRVNYGKGMVSHGIMVALDSISNIFRIDAAVLQRATCARLIQVFAQIATVDAMIDKIRSATAAHHEPVAAGPPQRSALLLT